MVEGRRQHAADLLRHLEVKGTLDLWNRELKEIDPYLQLVKAREDTTMPGLRPGYWHVLRHVPGGPPSVIVYEGPNGEFREPDSGLFEELRRGDMWSDRAKWERDRLQRKLDQAEQHRKERERKDINEEIRDRIKSAWNTSIRVPRSIR